MIFKESTYNPFLKIVERAKTVPEKESYSLQDLDYFRHELFIGGIVPENIEEFKTILTILREIKVI